MNLTKLLRDCSLLGCAIILIMIYGFIGQITLLQAFLFPTIYFFYVASVFYMEKKKKKFLENYFEMPILENNYIK